MTLFYSRLFSNQNKNSFFLNFGVTQIVIRIDRQ